MGISHCSICQGFSLFFPQYPANRLVRDLLDQPERDQSVSEHLHCPVISILRRITAGQRDQEGLATGVQLRLRPWTRSIIEGRIQSLEHVPLAEALHCGWMRVQRGGHFMIGGTLAGQEQQVRAPDHTGRGLALRGQHAKTNPLVLAQLDSIPLRSHASPPNPGEM